MNTLKDQLENTLIKLLVFRSEARVLLYRRLHAFVDNGVSINDAIERLYERYRSNDDIRHKMLFQWIQVVKRGRPPAEMFRDWSPPQEIVLIDAGISAGNASIGFEKTATMTENVGIITGEIKTALAYPAVLLSALIGIIVWFSVSMVPTFSSVIPPEKWVGDARQLYLLSEFIINKGIFLGVFLVILCFAFFYSLSRWHYRLGVVRDKLDLIPPYSIYRMYQSAVFLVSLSAMTKAGIPILNALDSIRNNAVPWLRAKIDRMRNKIKSGIEPGVALNSNLFDRETLDDLYVYGSLGDFNRALEIMGDRIISDSIRQVKAISKILNIILIAVVGVTVAWMFSALYSLPDALSNTSGI